ncbi:anthranilate phosphoribosyltransferase [Nitrosovibrio sp. Nv17]|uniref:anthranilate phosphoribosyltransferase n=1 Tax=Nitrosovibrio sp. Nv17 TaxID=1855339 RepID=UPI0009090F39|nr:anthranilate phosphoribosyltransferase [Nitrosovibrio sp. Nv17]SFW10619.1 anthranilate phosphoribosyltransferase [Nitrosovibrio sp. Nv17]
MTPQEALVRIIEHREIFHDEMLTLMRQIMRGELSPELIAAIVTGLRVKKETIGEIAAAAQVMREFATRVEVADPAHLVDTCGTGGDAAHTFNISTAAAFVAAAAGARVAKHGGRSVSSRSGSADVLEALGVDLDQTPTQVAEAIGKVGIGFMFAPNFHGAMKHAAPVRRELGVRTLFNILGPLTNPAGAKNQVLGVFHPDLVGILVRVLQRLGSEHVLVVHGESGQEGQGGLDEITIAGETRVGELRHGKVREYVIRPEDFGLERAPLEAIRTRDGAHARDMLLAVLDDRPGPARDVVLLNAGAAIYAAGLAESLGQGVLQARGALETGAARAKLRALVSHSRQDRAPHVTTG